MLGQSRNEFSGRIFRNLASFVVGFALISLSTVSAAYEPSSQSGTEEHSPVVVLDFWAPWCEPCLEINQRLDELESEMPGQFEVVRINVDEEPQMARRFDVGSLPTVIVVRDRNILGRFRGGRSKAEIREFLEEFLPDNPYAFLGPTAST